MGFTFDVSVPALTVFLQGLLSFFSPCILPLLPLYIGYLSGGKGASRKKMMLHTVCFVAGISFAFFLLGLGFSAIGTFFHSKQMLFARVGGILVILFGLYQLDVFGTSRILGMEHRLSLPMDKLVMSPFTACLMGFTFSFAWTPCVGPALTSVLLMAASAQTRMLGFVLIGVYTLGFVLPFLAVGLFTTTLLDFFKRYQRVVAYTAKLGGVLMIVMGLLMFTGKMNAVTGYLSTTGTETAAEETFAAEETTVAESSSEEAVQTTASAEDAATEETAAEETVAAKMAAFAFELTDQYGNVHTLEDYKGKMIFLNFWGTWCPPCRAELPDIQKLYEEYGENTGEELVVLGVAAPLMGQEQTEEEIKVFLEENELTYPVLMDTEWGLFNQYGIYSFPTTFMIDPEGNLYGYVSGQLSYDVMKDIIRQTKEGWNQQ